MSIRTEKYSSCWRILKGRLATGISGWYIQCSRKQEGEITTVRKNVQILHEMGVFTADEQYQKIAVVERHKATGKTGVGVVSGFGIQGGAIASSVSHDSHNIIVIGDNDEDMYLAVQELIRTRAVIHWLQIIMYMIHWNFR